MNLLSNNSVTLRNLTQFCNKKTSKYKNLVNICNELVKKVKKIWFLRQDPGWLDLIPARDQPIPEKGQKRAKGPNENSGARKCYLGPNFWNLAPKGPTWQPCLDVPHWQLPLGQVNEVIIVAPCCLFVRLKYFLKSTSCKVFPDSLVKLLQNEAYSVDLFSLKSVRTRMWVLYETWSCEAST